MHNYNLPAEASPDAAAFWHDFGFSVYPVDMLSGMPAISLKNAERRDRSATLASFSAHPGSLIGATVPAGVIALRVPSNGIQGLMSFLQSIGAPPHLIISTLDGGQEVFFSIDPTTDLARLRDETPQAIKIITQGGRIELPSGEFFNPSTYHAPNIAALGPLINAYAEPHVGPPVLDSNDDEPRADAPRVVSSSVLPGNPLEAYSMLGRAGELEDLALETTPLFGQVVLTGQSTIIYAPPNAGKTLLVLFWIMEAVAAGRVNPANVYYLNADDSGSGAAQKLRLLDEIGVHTIILNRAGFAGGSNS